MRWDTRFRSSSGWRMTKITAVFFRNCTRLIPYPLVCTQMEVAGGSARTTEAKALVDTYRRLSTGNELPRVVDDFKVALDEAMSAADSDTAIGRHWVLVHAQSCAGSVGKKCWERNVE